MDFGEKPKKRISINITSLVDILIVMLLFFMLTTQFIRMEVLHLDMFGNKNTGAAQEQNKTAITISLIGGGMFELSDSEFNLLQLKDKMKPLLEKNPDSPIILRSKSKAEVQDVVTAMDFINAVGGKNISVEEDTSDAGE